DHEKEEPEVAYVVNHGCASSEDAERLDRKRERAAAMSAPREKSSFERSCGSDRRTALRIDSDAFRQRLALRARENNVAPSRSGGSDVHRDRSILPAKRARHAGT